MYIFKFALNSQLLSEEKVSNYIGKLRKTGRFSRIRGLLKKCPILLSKN